MSLLKENNYRNWLILIVIFFIFLLGRFFRIDQRVAFDWDQERDARVVKEIISGKPTLLGPRVLGPDKFFLGPYFYYLLAPFYCLSHLHPRGMIYFLLTYNLIFFVLAYWLLKKLFGQKTTLIFLFLWSVNRGTIGADTVSWNPLVVPLITIIWLAVVGWIHENKRKKLPWLSLGLLLGIGINFHFQIIFLGLLTAIFLIKSKKMNFSNILMALVGFSATFFPLIIFDLRHNLLNTRLFLDFIGANVNRRDFFAWLPVLANFLSGFTGLSLGVPASLGLIAIFLFLAFLVGKKQKESFHERLFTSLVIFLALFLLGFGFYNQRPSEYYFNFLFPLLILLLAEFLAKQKSLLLILLLVCFWSYASLPLLRPVSFSLKDKDQAIQRLVEASNNEKINVSFSVPLGRDTGYRYLLDYYRVKLSDQPQSPLYKIVIPTDSEPVTEIVAGIGLFIPN
jgi:4-amino-4-deoxy-L-arabinose transferase-like glycosyltransferase